jgi:hypothetical protein
MMDDDDGNLLVLQIQIPSFRYDVINISNRLLRRGTVMVQRKSKPI